MAYIPGLGWESIVTGEVEAVPMDDIALSGVSRPTPAQTMADYTAGGFSGTGIGAGALPGGDFFPSTTEPQPGVIGAIAPDA